MRPLVLLLLLATVPVPVPVSVPVAAVDPALLWIASSCVLGRAGHLHRLLLLLLL
jgi:hypothetical protein